MTHGHVTDAIRYIRSLYAEEDDVLRHAAQRASDAGRPIHVGAEEGKLLQWLVRLSGARRIVEVGTLTAYSTVWVARGLPEGGQVTTLEHDPTMAALAHETIAEAGLSSIITLIEGDAQASLSALSDDGPFDMIFIDADKISYPLYLDWAEQHIRPGGLIIGDNTLLFGAVYQNELPEGVRQGTKDAMQQFNTRLADPARFDAVMVPTHEGLSVAIKR